MDITWNSFAINIIISFIVIYFIHNLWNYLRDTYTVKKTKDLLDFQPKKYREMLDSGMNSSPTSEKYSSPDFISQEDKEWMIQELSAILQ